MREIQKERPPVVLLDEFLHFGSEPVGQVFTLGRDVKRRRKLTVLLIGGEITLRRSRRIAGDVDIETLLLRAESGAAQVPFADRGGCVAGGAQDFGQGRL